MHPNPAFRKSSRERNVEFARRRSFGVLAVNAEVGPLISHIPFQLSEDGEYLEAHLVRSNPIVELLKAGSVQSVISASGGDGYISPDWYCVDNQVPTWNYVAVHMRGELQLLDQENLHGILERLSAGIEGKLTGKTPWKIEKMDQEIYLRMQRQIVPVGLRVADIQGTWKLSQNKADDLRERAAQEVSMARIGSETDQLVALMCNPNDF